MQFAAVFVLVCVCRANGYVVDFTINNELTKNTIGGDFAKKLGDQSVNDELLKNSIEANAVHNELLKNSLDQPDVHKIISLYNIPNHVTFTMYTREGPIDGELVKDKETLEASHFDPGKQTKLVTHGFLSSGNSDTCQDIKNAYMQNEDVNVVVVNWASIAANPIYPIVAMQTDDIGDYYGKFLDHLLEIGADPMKLHLIGHSLGAHISGFAGRAASKKVGRITGLDPAFPSFGVIQLVGSRLSRDQAHFVDVIHSSAGTFGLSAPIGHADFYPNGGALPQPGCSDLDEILQGCSHGRSWKYFKESIKPSVKFESRNCNNFDEFMYDSVHCNKESVLMGEYVPHNATVRDSRNVPADSEPSSFCTLY